MHLMITIYSNNVVHADLSFISSQDSLKEKAEKAFFYKNYILLKFVELPFLLATLVYSHYS